MKLQSLLRTDVVNCSELIGAAGSNVVFGEPVLNILSHPEDDRTLHGATSSAMRR